MRGWKRNVSWGSWTLMCQSVTWVTLLSDEKVLLSALCMFHKHDCSLTWRWGIYRPSQLRRIHFIRLPVDPGSIIIGIIFGFPSALFKRLGIWNLEFMHPPLHIWEAFPIWLLWSDLMNRRPWSISNGSALPKTSNCGEWTLNGKRSKLQAIIFHLRKLYI